MRAVVVFESMFGDNRDIALAIAEGLRGAGIEAEAVEVGAADPVVAKGIDLLVVGAPNHGWNLSRPATRADAATKTDVPLISRGIGVREWLQKVTLPPALPTAAYDTRASGPKAVVAFDHASATIAKGLAKAGGRPVASPEHFLVADVKGPLEPGEVERAKEWGRALAERLTTARHAGG